MRLTVTKLSDTWRRRLLASSTGGVLVLHEERRAFCLGDRSAWVIVGCRLVEPADIPICAEDIQEAFRATRYGESGGDEEVLT